MHYFIITFQAMIDGFHHNHATIGRQISDTDFDPHTIKQSVTDHYRKRHPDCEHIDVVIIDAQKVSEQQYNEASKDFVEIAG